MKKLENTKILIRRITTLGILIAVLCIFQFVPMIGYIPTPWGVYLTIMPIITGLVIIVFTKTTNLNAILAGFLIGLLSGALRHLSVFVSPGGLAYLWMNPLYNLVPALLWGVSVGILVHFIKNKKWYWFIGIMFSLLNTIYIVGIINIFQPTGYKLFTFMILITNALPEAAIGGVITFAFSKSMHYLRF